MHVYQPGTTPASPTLLLLHGTGGNEHDLLPLGRNCCPAPALLSPRGKVLEHGMPRFFRRLAEGVFDLEDLRCADRRARRIRRRGGGALRVRSGAGRSRWAFRTAPTSPASLVLLRPGVLRRARCCSARWCRSCRTRCRRCAHTPVLISNGRTDPIVPLDETERLAALLRAAGADGDAGLAAAGHHLVPGISVRAREWLGSSDGSTKGVR